MTDSVLEPVKEENIQECRACLQEINSCSTFYNLFDCVEQMGSTVAEKLSNVARVQITEADELPKFICDMCYILLQSAHSFIVTVKKTDELLRQKFVHIKDINHQEFEKEWPKPIQISSNIENTIIPHMEIKEELLSDEECFANHKPHDEHNISDLEIKIEPNTLQDECEFNRPTINGVCSLNGMEVELLESPHSKGHVDTEKTTTIKEEPVSAEEMEHVETDLSLECMLCTKTFNSVTGLKAHVITQHSYKGVKRKSDNIDSPEKVKNTYICEICKRGFETPTDLMVHETCHNKCKCYLCNQSFATFPELSQHRLTCEKKTQNNPTEAQKTLEVIRESDPRIIKKRRKRRNIKDYSLEQLNSAVSAIAKHNTSFSKAERIFGIPRRVISRYYHKKKSDNSVKPCAENEAVGWTI